MQGWGDMGDAGDCCFLTDALTEWQCEPCVSISTCVSSTARDIPCPFWPLRLSRVWQYVMGRGRNDGETA